MKLTSMMIEREAFFNERVLLSAYSGKIKRVVTFYRSYRLKTTNLKYPFLSLSNSEVFNNLKTSLAISYIPHPDLGALYLAQPE